MIVFRGSRSGAGERAMYNAQVHSTGSPDWITDMNIGKRRAVEFLTEENGVVSVNLATGFSLATESCLTSLAAAYKEATQGAQPQAIYITGHSLGGALAQCAYFECVVGKKPGAKEPSALRTLVRDCPRIICVPISAPGVVSDAPQAMSLYVDATQIMHYFHMSDLVHGGPKVDGGNVKNKIAEAFSKNNPHIGCEIGLTGTELFPDSHEPLVVWNRLHGKQDETNFWRKGKIDALAPLAQGVANPGGIAPDAFIDAVADSLAGHADSGPLVFAKCWTAAAASAGLVNFNKYLEQAPAYHKLHGKGPLSPAAREGLQKLHKTVVDERAAGMSKNSWKFQSATASAYWSLALYLALLIKVQQGRA